MRSQSSKSDKTCSCATKNGNFGTRFLFENDDADSVNDTDTFLLQNVVAPHVFSTFWGIFLFEN